MGDLTLSAVCSTCAQAHLAHDHLPLLLDEAEVKESGVCCATLVRTRAPCSAGRGVILFSFLSLHKCLNKLTFKIFFFGFVITAAYLGERITVKGYILWNQNCLLMRTLCCQIVSEYKSYHEFVLTRTQEVDSTY